MCALFMLLCIVIGGYSYLTDFDRVRLMAEGYLSGLMGGRVEIRRATLSLFQGLRLDGVKVYVDRGAARPDSLLFSAQAFIVSYDPRKLLAGQLEATQIIAQKPQVFLTLTQTPHGDSWNYQRLRQAPQSSATSSTPTGKLSLPELLLRNAVVEIGELKAGQRCRVGSMAIDGQLAPAGDGESYQFEMQTRGVTLGPYASGTVSVNTGQVIAHLRDVEFGEDLRSMFPADLRDWWERHELAGRIDAVDMNYWPAQGKAPARFSIQTSIRDVNLAVRREEWSGQQDVGRWQRTAGAFALLREPYRLAGMMGMPPSSDVFSPMQAVTSMVEAPPLSLRVVQGLFTFTQDGIDVNDLLVRVSAGDGNDPSAANAFDVRGHTEGYRPDAPLRLEITSADPQGLYFPAQPTFLDSLPREIRDFYQDLKPEGHCRFHAAVNRPVAGAVPRVNAEVDVVDAKFLFHQFPYPFRGASGRIVFGRDPFTDNDYVNVINMRGYGIVGGPNEKAVVAISGRVGPLGPENPEPGFNLRATGTNIRSEPRLIAAMPPEVRQALKVFDAPGKGEFPQFKGSFVCNITRPPGPRQRMHFDTALDLLDASGRIVGFPYPCRHVQGKLAVHDDYVDIEKVTISDGAATSVVSGRVRWADEDGHGQPLDMKVNIVARSIPVDNDLLGAIPPEQTQWLRKLGVAGKLDVDGTVFTVVPPDWKTHAQPGKKPVDPPVRYDLALAVHDGTIWPSDGLFSISSVTGKLHLTPERLDLIQVRGHRESADISARGWFTFAGRRPEMRIHISAQNLATDDALYALLPADGRKAWDEVRPSGTVDAEINYGGALGPAAPAAVASAAPVVALPSQDQPSFDAVLRPRKLSVRLKTAPYPMSFSQGSVTIIPGRATLKDLRGSHGAAKLVVSGRGLLTSAPLWELNLHGEGFAVNSELRRAMPPTLLAIVDSVKLGGAIGFDFPRVTYRGSGGIADPDIDVGGVLTFDRGTLDVGVPLTDIYGRMQFTAATRQGKINSIGGVVNFDSLQMGGRPVRDLTLELTEPPGRDELHVDKIQAKVAGGDLSGSGLLTVLDSGTNRYTMNMVLRNADVKALTGETDQDIRGKLTASLTLEGAWGERRQRRGRGDVVVAGKQLYKIPLMLGLLQVTNLSLPLSGPFTHGTARYNVEGARVNFEQVDLRSDTMKVSGTGYLDFDTRQVRMTLLTDNPGGLRIPFISELWQDARQQLLKIDLRGTVQEPKVQPTSMGIFTTTIDQVFKADGAKK